MASLAKASSDQLELNKIRELDSAEIEESADRHKSLETSEKHVGKPESMDRGREFTDILISTEIDPLPWKSSNFGISFANAGDKSPASYSSDLIGLDMAAGSNISLASDYDRETIHLPTSKSTTTPTNPALVEVFAYLFGNLPVIRQALEPQMWPQLDAIITRLKTKSEEAKNPLIKLPQELTLSNGKLSLDKTTDGLTRVSEKASTSNNICSGDNTVVLRSHGLAEDILTSATASNFLSEGEAPVRLTELSKANLGLEDESDNRTDSKKILIVHPLPAGNSTDVNFPVDSESAVTSHGQLEGALSASKNILNTNAELKGKEADFTVSINRPELGIAPEVVVEAQTGLVGKRGSFEGDPEYRDPIALCGARELSKPHGKHEEPRGYVRLSDETNVLPQLETHQTQGLGIFGVNEEHQPSPQPDFDARIESHSIFGTHLMPGQAKRERTLSIEHSISSHTAGAGPSA